MVKRCVRYTFVFISLWFGIIANSTSEILVSLPRSEVQPDKSSSVRNSSGLVESHDSSSVSRSLETSTMFSVSPPDLPDSVTVADYSISAYDKLLTSSWKSDTTSSITMGKGQIGDVSASYNDTLFEMTSAFPPFNSPEMTITSASVNSTYDNVGTSAFISTSLPIYIDYTTLMPTPAIESTGFNTTDISESEVLLSQTLLMNVSDSQSTPLPFKTVPAQTTLEYISTDFVETTSDVYIPSISAASVSKTQEFMPQFTTMLYSSDLYTSSKVNDSFIDVGSQTKLFYSSTVSISPESGINLNLTQISTTEVSMDSMISDNLNTSSIVDETWKLSLLPLSSVTVLNQSFTQSIPAISESTPISLSDTLEVISNSFTLPLVSSASVSSRTLASDIIETPVLSSDVGSFTLSPSQSDIEESSDSPDSFSIITPITTSLDQTTVSDMNSTVIFPSFVDYSEGSSEILSTPSFTEHLPSSEDITITQPSAILPPVDVSTVNSVFVSSLTMNVSSVQNDSHILPSSSAEQTISVTWIFSSYPLSVMPTPELIDVESELMSTLMDSSFLIETPTLAPATPSFSEITSSFSPTVLTVSTLSADMTMSYINFTVGTLQSSVIESSLLVDSSTVFLTSPLETSIYLTPALNETSTPILPVINETGGTVQATVPFFSGTIVDTSEPTVSWITESTVTETSPLSSVISETVTETVVETVSLTSVMTESITLPDSTIVDEITPLLSFTSESTLDTALVPSAISEITETAPISSLLSESTVESSPVSSVIRETTVESSPVSSVISESTVETAPLSSVVIETTIETIPISSVVSETPTMPIDITPITSVEIETTVETAPISSVVSETPVMPIETIPISSVVSETPIMPIETIPISSVDIETTVETAPVSSVVSETAIETALVSSVLSETSIETAPITSLVIETTMVSDLISSVRSETVHETSLVSSVLSDTIGETATVSSVLSDTVGETATVSSLLSDTVGETATVSSVLSDTVGETATISSVLSDSVGETVTVSSVLSDTVGETATVSSMLSDTVGETATVSSVLSQTSIPTTPISSVINETTIETAPISSVMRETTVETAPISSVTRETTIETAPPSAIEVTTMTSVISPTVSQSSTPVMSSVITESSTPEVTTLTVVPTLNMSEALKNAWVVTVIKVSRSENVTTQLFETTMESRLATTYNLAFIRAEQIKNGTYIPLRRRRRRRYAESGDVQLEMISVERNPSNNNVDLVYYMEKQGEIVPAETAVSTLALFSDQELALKLGYVVDTNAKAYVPEQRAVEEPPQYWIIAAVLGSIAGAVIIVWCSLCIYFRCCRALPVKDIEDEGEPHLVGLKDKDFEASHPEANYIQEMIDKARSNGMARQTALVNHSDEADDPVYAQVRKPKKRPPSSKPRQHPRRYPEEEDGSVLEDTTQYVSDGEEEGSKSQVQPPKRKPRTKRRSPGERKRRSMEETEELPSEQSTRTSIQYLNMAPVEKPVRSAQNGRLPNLNHTDSDLQQKLELHRWKNKQRQREKRRHSSRDKDHRRHPQPDQGERTGVQPVTSTSPSGHVPHVQGYVNGAYSESEPEADRHPQQTLDQARQRMHKLLDDAFSLVTPVVQANQQNKISPVLEPLEGDINTQDTRTRPKPVGRHKPQPARRRPSADDELQDLKKHFASNHSSSPPKPTPRKSTEKKHMPIIIDPGKRLKEANKLSWNPYRAGDQAADLALPQEEEIQPTAASSSPFLGRFQTTSLKDKSPISMSGNLGSAEARYAQSGLTTEEPQPIIITTRRDAWSDAHYADSPISEKYEFLPKDTSTLTTASKSSAPKITSKYAALIRDLDGDSVEGQTSPRSRKESDDQGRSIEMEQFGSSVKKSRSRHGEGRDELDVVKDSVELGVSPEPLIRSIREELMRLSSSSAGKNVSSC